MAGIASPWRAWLPFRGLRHAAKREPSAHRSLVDLELGPARVRAMRAEQERIKSSYRQAGLPAPPAVLYVHRVLELIEELAGSLAKRKGNRREAMLMAAALDYLAEVLEPESRQTIKPSVVDGTTFQAESSAAQTSRSRLLENDEAIRRWLQWESEVPIVLPPKGRGSIQRHRVLCLHKIEEVQATFAARDPSLADDPLFGGAPAERYQALLEHMLRRVIRIGVGGHGLSPMQRAVISAEQLETIFSAVSDLSESLVENGRDLYLAQRHLLDHLERGTWARQSWSVVRRSWMDASAITRRTGRALFNPRTARRLQRPDVPPYVTGSETWLSMPHSWQAQALSLPLRLWVKRQMKKGDLDLWRSRLGRLWWFARPLPSKVALVPAQIEGVQAEWIVPKGKPAARTLLYIPGGGFIFPATPMHHQLVANLGVALDANALLVHYRLAPEHAYPSALEDCLKAYRHLLEQGTDPSSIVIAGESAGGGLALSLLLAIKNEQLPRPGVAIAISALADLTYTGQSRVYNRLRDPILPIERSIDLNAIYLGKVPASDPLVSPVFGDFEGAPPILLQVGSSEILLDDSLRIAYRARSRGVLVRVEVWREMPHAWHLVSMIPETDKAIRQIAEFVRKHVPIPTKQSPDDRKVSSACAE